MAYGKIAPNYSKADRNVDDLHRESRNWLSEIEFWRFELSFYQKVLDKIALKLPGTEEKKRLDHFQNLITYYKGELLDQFEHDIRQHDHYLHTLARDSAAFNERLYQEIHQKHGEQLHAFEVEFRNYRLALYAFAEQFI